MSLKNGNWLSLHEASVLLSLSQGRAARYMDLNGVRKRIVPWGKSREQRQYWSVDVIKVSEVQEVQEVSR
jgi:hypothetical protein